MCLLPNTFPNPDVRWILGKNPCKKFAVIQLSDIISRRIVALSLATVVVFEAYFKKHVFYSASEDFYAKV